MDALDVAGLPDTVHLTGDTPEAFEYGLGREGRIAGVEGKGSGIGVPGSGP